MSSDARSTVEHVLSTPGRSLESNVRTPAEGALRADFSRVRIHTGEHAARSAAALRAKAYTVGDHVVFGAGQYRPRTHDGQRLLTHELAHAGQRAAGPAHPVRHIGDSADPAEREASTIAARLGERRGASRAPSATRRAGTLYRLEVETQHAREALKGESTESVVKGKAEDAAGAPSRAGSGSRAGPVGNDPPEAGSRSGAPSGKAAAKPSANKGVRAWMPGKVCGRPSRVNDNFPDTFISQVNIDVGNLHSGLTLQWTNATGKLGAARYPISPGAGKCCKDCNDDAVSQEDGSLCTPKGKSWKVNGHDCKLSGFPNARNPTFFQRPTIAIHSGVLGGAAASHGCVRTTPDASEIVHDNTIKGKTEIVVGGTWRGSTCYVKEEDTARKERSKVCVGGKLVLPKAKAQSAPAKKKTQPAPAKKKAKPQPAAKSKPKAAPAQNRKAAPKPAPVPHKPHKLTASDPVGDATGVPEDELLAMEDDELLAMIEEDEEASGDLGEPELQDGPGPDV
jgi:hypothetical protein